MLIEVNGYFETITQEEIDKVERLKSMGMETDEPESKTSVRPFLLNVNSIITVDPTVNLKVGHDRELVCLTTADGREMLLDYTYEQFKNEILCLNNGGTETSQPE